MGQDQGEVGPAGAAVSAARPPEDPAQARADIEVTRRELGDTVAALAEKTDVKARAREKVAEVRGTVTEKRAGLLGTARERSPGAAGSAAVRVRARARAHPVASAAVAAVVGGVVLGRITKRR
jgi:hypothetical protein